MPYHGRLTRRQAADIGAEARRRCAAARNHGPAVSLMTHRVVGGEFGAGAPSEAARQRAAMSDQRAKANRSMAPRGSFVVPVPDEHVWTAREQRVFRWWLTSSKDRKPVSWEAMCRSVGHTQDVIERWMLEKPVEGEYRRRVDVQLRYRRHAVHEATFARATNLEDDQGVRAQRTLLEVYGDLHGEGSGNQAAAAAAGAMAGAAAAIGAQAMRDLVGIMRENERASKAIERERVLQEEEGLDAALERPLLEGPEAEA